MAKIPSQDVFSDERTAGEFKLLRHQFDELIKDGEADRNRIRKLEQKARDLETKLSVGKGLIVGMLITTGGVGVLVADKLKTLVSILK